MSTCPDPRTARVAPRTVRRTPAPPPAPPCRKRDPPSLPCHTSHTHPSSGSCACSGALLRRFLSLFCCFPFVIVLGDSQSQPDLTSLHCRSDGFLRRLPRHRVRQASRRHRRSAGGHQTKPRVSVIPVQAVSRWLFQFPIKNFNPIPSYACNPWSKIFLFSDGGALGVIALPLCPVSAKR